MKMLISNPDRKLQIYIRNYVKLASRTLGILYSIEPIRSIPKLTEFSNAINQQEWQKAAQVFYNFDEFLGMKELFQLLFLPYRWLPNLHDQIYTNRIPTEEEWENYRKEIISELNNVKDKFFL